MALSERSGTTHHHMEQQPSAKGPYDHLKANHDSTLDSFIKYCEANPSERFWQALKNWANVDYLFFGYATSKYGGEAAKIDGNAIKVFLTDTYHLEGRYNEPVQPHN